MPILDHFGLLAPVYEKFIPPSNPDRLLKLLEPEDGNTLLDVGGGTGRVTGELRSIFKHAVIVDLSHQMLSQAKEKRLDGAQSHSESLPFRSNLFERIIIVDALHHVCNQAETAEEMFRVLAPGGFLVIEEPNFEHFFVKILAAMERIALMRSRFLPPDGIAQLFEGKKQKTSIHRDGSAAWIVVQKLR